MPYPKQFDIEYTPVKTGQTTKIKAKPQQSLVIKMVQNLEVGDKIVITRIA